MNKHSADEIQEFLQSGEAGTTSQFSRDTLEKTAEKLFTAQGLHCPVKIVKIRNQTYILRRDAL